MYVVSQVLFFRRHIGTVIAAESPANTADASQMVLQAIQGKVGPAALLAAKLAKLILATLAAPRVYVRDVPFQRTLVYRLERALLAKPLRLDSAALQVLAQAAHHLVASAAPRTDKSPVRLGTGLMGLAPVLVQAVLAGRRVVAEAALERASIALVANMLGAGRVIFVRLQAAAALVDDVGAVAAGARVHLFAGDLWIGQVTARAVQLQHGLGD